MAFGTDRRLIFGMGKLVGSEVGGQRSEVGGQGFE